MLTPEEEQTLNQYIENYKSLPLDAMGGYVTLPISNVQWLAKKLKEGSEELKKQNCYHLQLKVIYMENEEGSVQLEICKNDRCSYIRTLCEHKINEWVYTCNQENPEEKKLICKLCGADGT